MPPWQHLYPRVSLSAAPVALEAIPQALWFFLPAFIANPMAVVFGGGPPIDLGRSLSDGQRIFGDGKTWRGLVGGTLAGAILGLLAIIVITPALHRAVNLVGYRMGKKHEPW